MSKKTVTKKNARKAVKKTAQTVKKAVKHVAAAKPVAKIVRFVAPKPVKVAAVVRKPVLSPKAQAAAAAKTQSFAFSIAEEMKKQQLAELKAGENASATSEIKLSRRPTTRAPGKNTVQFPKADLEQFRKALIALREAVTGQSGALRNAALEQTDERTAEDDDGTDAFMRLQALGQVGSQNATIQKIDDALHAIDDGTYGVCEVCGQLIRKQRLLHLPFAHTCMECQSAMEHPFGGR